MTFKASNILPQRGYDEARNIARNIKRVSNQYISSMSSGSTSNEILDALWFLNTNSDRMNSLKTIPGIGDYAKAQEDDPAYDVVAEFNALIALVDDAETWIRTTLPTDGDDYLLINKLNEDSLIPRDFTSGQVAPLVTKLQAISDQIS